MAGGFLAVLPAKVRETLCACKDPLLLSCVGALFNIELHSWSVRHSYMFILCWKSLDICWKAKNCTDLGKDDHLPAAAGHFTG